MGIDRLLKRQLLVVVLGLVALAAYLQASIAIHLIGSLLIPDNTVLGAGGMRSAGAAIPGEEKTAEAILSRNPFDSVTGSLIDNTIAPAGAAASVGPTDPLSAPGCEGVRVSIVSEGRDPEWSMATLEVAGAGAAKQLRLGDSVTRGRIAYIGYNPRKRSPAVWIDDNSSICQALLFAAAPSIPAPTAAPDPTPPSSAPGALAPALAEIASQIKKLSETEFDVDRGVIDKVLRNQELLMQSTRVVPEHKDGKVVGIRLFGMRPDTLLTILGFQNGDRLESINGIDMISPEKMLEAYARLPSASRLTVKIHRHGKATSLDYRLK